MSTGICCKIKLDPFLQEFLRGFYSCSSIVFKFPKENQDELHLAKKFNDLLDSPPADFKPDDFGDKTFMIEVPYIENRDPFYWNYLSKTSNEKLSKKIFEAYRDYYYDFIREKRSKGWCEYKDIVDLFIDKMRLNQKYYDRLTKDYQRWRIIKNNKKYQQKLQRESRAHCPV